MKNFFSILFAMLLTLAFTACGSSAKKAPTTTTKKAPVCVPAPGEICQAK